MGLGQLKITFDAKNAIIKYFTRVLQEKFLLLKNAGCYSICRAACKWLSAFTSYFIHKISLPYQLRNDSLLKQAVAYICILQKSNGFNHEFNFKEILQVKVHITSQHVAGVFIVL